MQDHETGEGKRESGIWKIPNNSAGAKSTMTARTESQVRSFLSAIFQRAIALEWSQSPNPQFHIEIRNDKESAKVAAGAEILTLTSTLHISLYTKEDPGIKMVSKLPTSSLQYFNQSKSVSIHIYMSSEN
jgi:hypothetical protein